MKKQKQLRRSYKKRMIAGVCAGLGYYFDKDPTVIRLIFILLLLLGGATILAYLVMWVVIPLDKRL